MFYSLSTQFLPHTGDRILITGAADTKVHVHDLTVKETIHMFSDHTNRVKRIATAPMWPNTFWSAAEDGMIRCGSPCRQRPSQWLSVIGSHLFPPCPPQAVWPEGEQQTLRSAGGPDGVLWSAGGSQVSCSQPAGQQLPGSRRQRAFCSPLWHQDDPQLQVGSGIFIASAKKTLIDPYFYTENRLE